MSVGILTIHIMLPGCTSLKEKRSRIKPLLARLHKEFNISVAEMEKGDAWQESILGCAVISNDAAHNQRLLQQVVRWIETSWPDITLVDDRIEIV